MKAQWTKRWWSFLALIVLSIAASGCMTERSPIDTTDPLSLDKRLFEGEFFYKQTVVDIPYTVDYSFIGETNALKIIRWEVTENWLIAYNIHEKIEATDTNGEHAMSKVPVAAYPIMKHFDIQLAQNSVTGEDLPMLVENYDKPWWQRRYFVIDPSSSAVTNFELEYLNITIDWDNPFYMEPVAGYYQMEFHDGENRAINPKDYELRYKSGKAENQLSTFSFRTDWIISPNNSWRGIYTWSDVEEFINWEPARFGLRHFFWKVDREELNNNGFKTMEFQDDMFKRFGFFVRTYRGVDPQVGYRENYSHQWANYFNIEGDNKIVYYINGELPESMVLTACSIAADYNWAFSKAYYEGKMARKQFDETGRGFISDFPEMTKLTDGLYQIDNPGATQDSTLVPDADTPWPADYNLVAEAEKEYALSGGKWRKYYYIDYNVEGYIPPAEWSEDADGKRAAEFADKQQKMVKAYLDYCFTEHESDKFVLRRNTMLEYDFDRDGVSPEGIPTLITPDEIVAIYGETISSRTAKPVDYAVACKQTLEHRCELDANGNKIARWEKELGDPRYSFIYWVDTPTEYGILGVAQWSDNPETGQIFSGSAHIAGSVLQWSVSRELEQYFMLEELKKDGYNPTSSRYQELLDDLIIDAEYTRLPVQGEENSRPTDEVNPPPSMVTGRALLTAAKPKLGPALTVGSEAYNLSALTHMPGDAQRVEDAIAGDYGMDEQRMRLETLKEKHLPKMRNNLDLSKIKGTQWESRMASSGMLDYLYPDATSYNEEMLYQISPLYYGTQEAMMKLKEREIKFTTGCYYQSEWLDGGFIEFIERLDRAGYTREQIRRFVERVMFKGVAQHEVGHSIGLRHNFMGSADELNYVGNKTKKTGYWAFKEQAETILDEKVQQFFTDNGRMPTPMEKFYLERSISSPKNWYMYSSVMDYMAEFYNPGFGLGGYDVSALRYVYGKSVEKYKTDGSNVVEVSKTTGEPTVAIEPLFEDRYCTENDLHNSTCACVPGMPKEGARDEDCVCTNAPGMTYCYNAAQTVEALRYEPQVKAVADDATGEIRMVPVDGARVGVQVNGDNKPYLYCPDNWMYEHPMCNVWDRGYTARDIVRGLAESYKMFYFWRFFRRGNPRFRRTSMWGSVMRFFPFAHFALDFNYNQFQIKEWQELLLNQSETPFPSSGNIPLARKEYILALNGVEEWVETVNGKEEAKTLTPGGPGDYLIAAMEGFNFLVYDVIYSADVGKHVKSSWKEDASHVYFEMNPYIYDEADLEDTLGGAIVNVDLRYGHHHKNQWDFQNDMSITQPKLERRGFTVEKDAASFVIANSGWWVDKYAFESMANSFAYVSDGLDAAIFQVMANVVNENSMTSLSRYCVEQTGRNEYQVRPFLPRVNELFLWNWTEDWDPNGAWYPKPSDPTKSMCEKASEQTGKPLIPLHASWVYFDKMEPVMWSIYNQSNIMADNTIYEYYYTVTIPVGEHDLWEPVDGVSSTECLNSKESLYYRAYKRPTDFRPSPIFDVVKRCRAIQDTCVINQSLGQVPGNLGEDCDGYPRWYLNRDLENMESAFMLMNSFSAFWTDTAKLFFW